MKTCRTQPFTVFKSQSLVRILLTRGLLDNSIIYEMGRKLIMKLMALVQWRQKSKSGRLF
jgi:hypothetical protein